MDEYTETRIAQGSSNFLTGYQVVDCLQELKDLRLPFTEVKQVSLGYSESTKVATYRIEGIPVTSSPLLSVHSHFAFPLRLTSP